MDARDQSADSTPNAPEGSVPSSSPEHDEATLAKVRSAHLRAAALEIADTWARSLKGGVSRDEVLRVLATLTGAVEEVMERGPTEPVPEALRPGLLHRQLAELLHQELLNGWRSGATPDPALVLDTLMALDAVRARLEPDRGEDFAARLLQPDAFELIVEVAHDLRSPLTSILFLSETLRRGHSGEVNELQHRQLGLIYSAALGLISVASDIMELARGGWRLAEEEPETFSVREVLEGVREMVQIMADEKNITLAILPPEGDRCLGYPVPLSRALLNLTTNALKFTEEGLVEVVARRKGRAEVEFSVRDTGRGIDPASRETLFEPFRKARERPGHFFSGSGLGLSIAWRLVEAMGSELRFESQAGWGTRFYFTVELPPARDV